MPQEIKKQLQHFFPAEPFNDEIIAEYTENGDIISDLNEILPYLQTALLDEKIIEVELDGAPRVYITRLEDSPPADTPEQTNGEEEEHEYQKGDYLQDLSHLVSLPLEPGLGNLSLRHSKTIMLRMFTNAYAVEFGTRFVELIKIDDIPALKLEYPQIARIVRNAREFRAKVPDSLDLILSIDLEDDDELIFSPVDISIKGMAFSTSKDEQKTFHIDDEFSFKLYLDDELLARLNGTIKHLSKIRKETGIEYISGLQFDLESRTTASVVESIVATVQRAHLKELAALSDSSGLNLIA